MGERSQWSGAVMRNVVIVVTASFIIAAGFTATNLLLPYYIMALRGLLRELPEKLAFLHASRVAVDVGGLVTSFMAARALVAAASGWLSDRFGRRPLIVAGLGLYAVSQAAYYYSSSVWQLFLVRAVQGIASALTWPVAEALLMDSVPAAVRTRAMSLYVVSFNLGNVVGPLLGSAAYAVSKAVLGPRAPVVEVFRLPFMVLAGPAAAVFALGLLVREPGWRRRAGAGREAFSGGLLGLPGAVKRALTGFYFNALVNGFAMGIVASVMIVYVIDYIARTPEAAGVAMAVPGIVGLVFSYPVARAVDRMASPVSRKRLLVTTMALSRLGIMAVGYVRSLLGFIALMSLLNISMNIILPMLRSIEGGLVPGRLRGKVFGLHQAFFNAGMTFGPLLGSWIYQEYHDVELLPGVTGVEAAFIIAGLLGLAALPLIVLLYDPLRVEEAWSGHRAPQ